MTATKLSNRAKRKTSATPRNVQSGKPDTTTDAHERRKDYLHHSELDAFLTAARSGRHGIRDHALALTTARHGLRVSELVDLRISDLHIDEPRTARMTVKRLKHSLDGEHPIQGDELRALKAWLDIRPERSGYDNVFLNERRQPFNRKTINYLFGQIALRAKLPHVNPHMLRHTCGFLLAENNRPLLAIQHYLGHRQPANTVRYARISASQFDDFFRRKGKA